MSLLPTANNANSGTPYFVLNGSMDGATTVIRTGNGIVQIQPNSTDDAYIYAEGGAGGTLTLGANEFTFGNITLTDANVNVFKPLSVQGGFGVITQGDVSCGGNLVLSNGATGSSVSGYYSVPTAPLNCPDASDTVVPNPAGLTQGYYIIAVSTAVGGQNQQQVSTLAYRTSGGLWAIGGCCSSIAGAGRFGLNVSTDRTTMLLSNSTGVAQNGCTVYFSKILN